MKKNLHTLLLAVLLPLLVCLGSCLQDETIDGPAPAGKGITISYTFDDLQTRGIAATTAEKQLGDVYFVFYTSGADGTYVGYMSTSGPSTASGTGSLQLPISGGLLTVGQTYRTLIVANYNSYKADGETFDTYINNNRSRNYDDMRRHMKSQTLNQTRAVTPLPLFGTLLGSDGQESLFTAPDPELQGVLPVSVRFSRAVCRIDLRNQVADELVIAWAKVCNYRDAGFFFHQDVPLGDLIKGTSNSAPDPNNLPAGYVKADPPTGAPPNVQNITGGGLYAYPNIVTTTLQDDQLTTCVLIAGYYTKKGEPLNDTKLTYYRANVADIGLSQVLKRNYVYTLVITGVKGPGADTEEGGMNQKAPLLDFVVDNEWQGDPNNTVVDENGNFLAISRTSVVLDSPEGEAAAIKVAVKEGLDWIIDKSKLTDAFTVEKIDNQSFLIKTTGVNATEFIKSGEVTVKVTGINPEPMFPLQITVNITQLSSLPEVKMLAVEGQTGVLNLEAPGQGGPMSLMVLTGGTTGAWVATPDAALGDFIEDTWPKRGGNKGAIVVRFKPNVSGAARKGVLTVTRDPADGVPPVTINFNQEKSPYRISVFPAYGNGMDKLVINGFDTEAGPLNGVAKEIPFWVTLADPTNYTITVESTFRKDVDAYIAWGVGTPLRTAAYTASTEGETITGGESGVQFTLYVFRTGPGDPPIEGTIFMKAVPKSDSYPAEQISFAVSIESQCGLGDVKIGSLTVADRNCGTPLKAQLGAALNYTNQANHPDKINSPFKGGYYSFDKISTACKTYGKENYAVDEAKNWREPTYEELSVIAPLLISSKQRWFLISDDKTSGYIGCWFPLSGSSISTGQASGWYGCSWQTSANGGRMYVHYHTDVRGVGVWNKGENITIRCVRTN